MYAKLCSLLARKQSAQPVVHKTMSGFAVLFLILLQKKSKLKKKKKKGKVPGAVDQSKYGAFGILRESDMFAKQQEFYSWLQEIKNVNPETLPKFETRKMFDDYMEDYNTATLPHKKYILLKMTKIIKRQCFCVYNWTTVFPRYYNLEKWEAKKQQKNELKALKKARDNAFSIVDDEKRHELLHRKVAASKHGISFGVLLQNLHAYFSNDVQLLLRPKPGSNIWQSVFTWNFNVF